MRNRKDTELGKVVIVKNENLRKELKKELGLTADEEITEEAIGDLDILLFLNQKKITDITGVETDILVEFIDVTEGEGQIIDNTLLSNFTNSLKFDKQFKLNILNEVIRMSN